MVTTLNIALDDDLADRARETKDALGLTWAEFIVAADESLREREGNDRDGRESGVERDASRADLEATDTSAPPAATQERARGAGDDEHRESTDSAAPIDHTVDSPDTEEVDAGDLDDLLERWTPGRDREERETRRALGREVLAWFQETEGFISAAGAKDALYPELAYADESVDTWWRKIARPPIQAAVDAGVAQYREGHHDYRWVGEGTGSSSRDVYDPTEEF